MKNDNEGCLGLTIGILLAAGLSLLFAWLVGSSDLPDWMKFYLLS